jgi:hypothetical protein
LSAITHNPNLKASHMYKSGHENIHYFGSFMTE